MIDALTFVPASAVNDNHTTTERSGMNRGARSQDANWVYKLNPPNPLGRHPFNIITEEIYND